MKTFSLETLLDVETLPVKGPYRGELAVTEGEQAALADRFGFVELRGLTSRLRLPVLGRMRGTSRAD